MNKTKKLISCILLFSLCTFLFSYTQAEKLYFKVTFDTQGPFTISKEIDIPLNIIAVAFALTPKIIELTNKEKTSLPEFSNNGEYVIRDKGFVNAFDRLIMNPYSKGLDITATGIEALSLISPALLFLTPSTEWSAISNMYGQVLLFAYGAKELLKLCVKRARPYMYFAGAPEKALYNGDWTSSFPSGHTTITFASAAFLSYAFAAYFPGSKWTTPVIATAYTLALSTAVLRLFSGNHFMTDVLTGAAIGSLCGFAIPFFHYTKKVSDDKVEISATPLCTSVRIKY